jgi:hypothetical protein
MMHLTLIRTITMSKKTTLMAMQDFTKVQALTLVPNRMETLLMPGDVNIYGTWLSPPIPLPWADGL